MPDALERSDRRILIAAGALLVLLSVAGLFLGPGGQSSALFPSSYSTAAGGAKAAFLLLQELGYGVERWERPPADLPESSRNVVLVLADPVILASAAEKQLIGLFVARGGRVLATGPGAGSLLPEAHVTGPEASAAGEFAAQLPSPITRGAPGILLQPGARWTPGPAQVVHYGNPEGPVVVSYGFGQGRVVWWAGSSALSNSGLGQASNLALFLNSVGPSEGSRVLWDEYFHGQQPGLARHFGRTPAPWMALQLLLVAAAALATYSRRAGPVVALAREGSRLSPLEFVETLGDLYHRKGAAREALEVAYHRFRFLLLRRLGLPSAAAAERIAEGVRERLGEPGPQFLDLLRDCEQQVRSPKLAELDALRLIGRLHDLARRWRLEGRGEQR